MRLLRQGDAPFSCKAICLFQMRNEEKQIFGSLHRQIYTAGQAGTGGARSATGTDSIGGITVRSDSRHKRRTDRGKSYGTVQTADKRQGTSAA